MRPIKYPVVSHKESLEICIRDEEQNSLILLFLKVNYYSSHTIVQGQVKFRTPKYLYCFENLCLTLKENLTVCVISELSLSQRYECHD